MNRVVIDTNVLAGALNGQDRSNRAVLRASFEDRLLPVIGESLFLEYEDVAFICGTPAVVRGIFEDM